MEFISVFDMFKVCIGPSSSHTLGPWRAAQRFLEELKSEKNIQKVNRICVELYGSLSLTGKGHATDFAIMLGLSGFDPADISVSDIPLTISTIKESKKLTINNELVIDFFYDRDIVFKKEFLPLHNNGLKFISYLKDKTVYESTFYSIGGGFITKNMTPASGNSIKTPQPYPINSSEQLLNYCKKKKCSISDVVQSNELAFRSEDEIQRELEDIWSTMKESIYTGCHSEGVLPGGLSVRRRAYDIHKKLIGDGVYHNIDSWMQTIRKTRISFRETLKWVSCFALSVNEVNAAMGRVITAPTNGSAGVIPAVIMYYMVIENHQASVADVRRFLLVAGEIGSIFKKGATISAAMGGCQAEIGVSSAMAAAALCELMGGSPEQVIIAAEIAMEHHLGLTCDPVGGLVQIPCIERNSMGAIKAINAAELSLETDWSTAKVSLDKVIKTMWETAKDMNLKYKETSKGGLAITVDSPSC